MDQTVTDGNEHMAGWRIGIVGAGTMGGGIAQMLAENGHPGLLWDVDRAALDRGVTAIRTRLEKSVAKEKIPVDRCEQIMARLHKAETLADLAQSDLVIEAVVEDPDVKTRVFADVESVVPASTIVATNTSSLSVSALAGGLSHPERFLGVHFFNPPTKLELVEVVAGDRTAPETVAAVKEFLSSCAKTPVSVKDSPGFIVNRLLLLFINEAIRMADEGVATPADIDTAMRLGALHPVGPLAIADLIGLDTCHRILAVLRDTLKSPAYEPAQSLRRLVDEGKLGRKAGAGFYEY